MIIFRVDGNPRIGSGHIMRCLSIADAAKEQGKECRFITADDCFASIIRQRGFACDVLQTSYCDMNAEQENLSEFLERYQPEAILADSYFVTPEYLAFLGRFAEVMYLDDLAAFAYPVKRVVNYNIYGPDIDYAGLYDKANVPLPQLLLGPGYAPLRRQFQNLAPRETRQKVQDILISTGGADSQHIALQLARHLAMQAPLAGIQYHFVVGAMNADLPALQSVARECATIKIHQNVQNMAQLMQQCDLAIAAAGSTLYELCVCGVPTITYAMADNQLSGMYAFTQKELMTTLGKYRKGENFIRKLFDEVQALSIDQVWRNKLSKKMQQLIDGGGANRLVQYLGNGKIHL